MTHTDVAIIGSGNIGTDLMFKILRTSKHLRLVAMVGIDEHSDGLKRAREHGIETTHLGIKGLRELDCYDNIQIVFDATSAGAHANHDRLLREDKKQIVDLTPAAIGPYVVPPVNLASFIDEANVNMVTCGGQATIPIVAAVNRVADVHYGEIVASISSKSAGPGTRANIDEFTETTSRAIEQVGGAKKGKAIIVLNPAEPAMVMRDTVYCVTSDADEEAIADSIESMVAEVQTYVPGYRLKQDIQFQKIGGNNPVYIPDMDKAFTGLLVSVFLEVEGAGHYLPAYAGNLDIMTSAALQTAERLADLRKSESLNS
ncbi:MAG: acetaldehyde dehydrogenase (acetylating) [Parvibaculaceae bacterium]